MKPAPAPAPPLTAPLPAHTADVAGDAAGLALRLLGNPGLWRGAQPLQRLNPADAALLALLALDGPQPRQRLAALLWPDATPAGGASNLRQRLFRLRRQAGVDLVLGDRVLALAPGLGHDLDSPADGLAADPQHAAGALLGPADYADNTELAAQVAGLRARWRERLAQALAHLAEQLAGQARVAAALPYAERLVAELPLAEHAHRRLMRLHHQRGDRAAALAAFERCRRLLHAELGVAPGGETQALLQQVQRAQPAPANAPAPKPVVLLRPPRLVGRDALWAQASQALSAGRPVLLLGEAGLGKSRLLADLASARSGWQVVAAQPGDSALAYALLARCVDALLQQGGAPQPAWAAHELARIAPAAGQGALRNDTPGDAPTDDSFSALRLQQAFKQALLHWRAGGLAGLALDDLHFADEASLALLAPLVAGAGPSPLGWLLASRPVAQPGPALQAWLHPIDSPCQPLALSALGLDGVQALLDSLALPGIASADWAGALLRHTGGHPLWLLQTLASVLDQGPAAQPEALHGLATPADVQRLIDARLARLSEPARQLVRLAAVAGADFSVDLAAAVLGVHALALADAWQELQDQQVLRGPAFVHDLLRTAARRGVPDDIARVLHRQVADALAGAAGRAAVSPACLAAHWDAAGEPARAALAFEAAARQAQARSALAEELQALRGAARCHRAAAGPLADGLALRPGAADGTAGAGAFGDDADLGAAAGASLDAAFDCDWHAVRLLLQNESGEQALATARQLCLQARDGHQRAAAHEALARTLIDQMDAPAALAAAQQAVAEADAVGDQRLGLLATQAAANALARQDDSDQALALLRAREGGLGVLGTDERLLWLSDLATALDYADQRSQAVAVFDRVITEAEASGRWAMAGEAWNNKAIALLYLARLAEGSQALQRSLDCGHRTGLAASDMLITEMSLAGNLRDEGQFARYLPRAQALPAELRATGHAGWAANAQNDLGVAYAWLGRLDLAGQALAALPDDVAPWVRAARLLSQAHLAHDFGLRLRGDTPAQRVDQACALLKAAGAWGRRHVRLHLRLAQARELPLAQRLPEAAALRAEALATDQRMLAAQADVLYIPWLLAAGQPALAAQVAHALAERCAQTGPPPGVYHPRLGWVIWCGLQSDHPAAAAQALRQAGAWIAQVAAQQVPALYVQSFLHRNPVNVAVRSALSSLALAG